jgi:large subunit ribosomal protein L29
MAKKEKQNYKEFTVDELRQQLVETREKLFQMKFQNTTAPLKNPHAISETRRNIARIHTALKQKGVSV